VTITGLPRTVKWASVYTENRAVRVVDGTLTDRFARWQVHVYRFAVSPAAAHAD
jgi:ligand-binding SRPBCC domain-containing protein